MSACRCTGACRAVIGCPNNAAGRTFAGRPNGLRQQLDRADQASKSPLQDDGLLCLGANHGAKLLCVERALLVLYNAASVTGHAIMEKAQKNKQSVKKEKTTRMQLRAVRKS